jgi:hypothetical protein
MNRSSGGAGTRPTYSIDSVWPTRVQFAIEVAGDHIITAADPLPTTSVQLSRRSTASGAVRTSLIKVGFPTLTSSTSRSSARPRSWKESPRTRWA